MKELYEAVLCEAKAAVRQDQKAPGVGFSEETHFLIVEAIKLHCCANGLPDPDFELPPIRTAQEL